MWGPLKGPEPGRAAVGSRGAPRWLPGAAMMKCQNLGGLKRCLLTQFWSLEVGSQGVGRAVLPLKALGEDPSWPLPASGVCWLP